MQRRYHWRDAELPAHGVVFAEPVGVVEWRVGEDVVGAEVGMEVAAEGVGGLGAEVGLDAAQGAVHDAEAAAGSVALVTVDAHVEVYSIPQCCSGNCGGWAVEGQGLPYSKTCVRLPLAHPWCFIFRPVL